MAAFIRISTCWDLSTKHWLKGSAPWPQVGFLYNVPLGLLFYFSSNVLFVVVHLFFPVPQVRFDKADWESCRRIKRPVVLWVYEFGLSLAASNSKHKMPKNKFLFVFFSHVRVSKHIARAGLAMGSPGSLGTQVLPTFISLIPTVRPFPCDPSHPSSKQ